ncbi:adhesion G-protein coupled receptor F1-like isoform X2 [Gasterosteus aculeatus]
MRSNGGYEHQPSAVITVSPVRRTVPCQREREVLLMCSVNSPYEVEFKDIPTGGTNQITHRLSIDCEEGEKIVLCKVKNHADLDKTMTLSLTKQTFFQCEHGDFGVGNEGDLTEVPCNEGDVGEKILVCGKDGVWRVRRDNCILQPLLDLLKQAELLDKNSLPTFLKILSDITHNFTEKVVESPANIKAVVEIFDIVANLNISITKTSMRDILLTTGVLTTDGAKTSWDILNTDKITNITAEPVSRRLSDINSTKGDSSTFLLSLEKFTKQLSNESFNIDTPFILLNKTTFTDNFNAEFNSSVEINLLQSDGGKNSLTVITFASMDNVLSVRDVKNSTMNVINGRVVLVQSSGAINNVSFTFDILDEALKNPKCVFWNFSLFEGIGGWGGEGCELVNHLNRTVTCKCNHLTSFSILMSPYAPDDDTLSIITYVGVGISICSLVICLIIEAAIWRKIRRNKTSYLRHVTVVNIAVSLLIADVWFIIGVFTSAADKRFLPACTATTFFIHFFYLAMFFWMLTSALLLLHRTVNVFDVGLSNKSMLAIGFTLGYGAPLVIAIITIAATFPKVYVQENSCWLNWYQSKALLAFVVPAFLIIVINLIILLLVIYKILRRRLAGTTEQAAERHILLVISRCLAVLTPLFGLTWGLGVGTLTNPKNNGIHISFAFFNSLQGFFILVFGTLLDKKVQSELAQMAQSHRSGIRSTISELSSGGLGFWPNWRRGVYHVSSGEHSSSDTSRNT